MRRRSNTHYLLSTLCTLGLLAATALRAPAQQRPQNTTPREADVQKLEAALPDSAPAKPQKQRKVLAFGHAAGFVHSSIPLGCKAVEELGKKTGAWETVISYDPAVFDADNLKQFDAIVLVSTTGNFMDAKDDQATSEKRRQAFIDFVNGGKGVVGIHAACDAYYDWNEYGQVIGGYFSLHKAGNEKVSVVNEDPKNPITAPFEGKGFEFADEIYRMLPSPLSFGHAPPGAKQTYSREKVHVLLSVDPTKHNNEPAGTDMPVSWCHEVGKGRVFYVSLGHNEYVYYDPTILKYYLAGIQYAIGDLKAEDQPGRQPAASAQPARPRNARGPQGPQVISPQVHEDRRVTFRILAPNAQNVRVSGGDIPGIGRGEMTKGENGVWEATLGPIGAGAYRYNFNVNGVTVIDPRNPAVSESNNNVWSLVVVPGSDFIDVTNVPHGAVASVYYESTALGRTRRMHVYTPPGYESGMEKYPVFYLLHGAGDCDDSWTSVGRANFILDNLIAAKKAKPMIVVMPAGHTNLPNAAPGPRTSRQGDEFVNDFLNDIVPYVEKHYRVLTGRENRAIAGLSMGGGQTLAIALPHVGDYSYVGVFSSGLFQQDLSAWEKQHEAELDNPARQGVKLFWFGTGSDDFLLARSKQTVELLKKHNFNPEFHESTGGHTWINWRNYLNEFAPQLFR